MTVKLVLENLKNKPVRTLLSVLLIGIPVTLILTLVGLSHGMLEDTQRRARAVGADIIIRPPNSTLLSANASISEQFVPALQKAPHVKLAVGIVNYAVQGITLVAAGVDLQRFGQMSGGFRYLDHGGPVRGPDDVLIDETYAAEKGLRTGGDVTLLNRKWRICGIFEGGKLARIIFPKDVLQALTGNVGKVNQIYLQLDNPANTASVIQYLKEHGYQDFPIYPMKDFIAMWNVNNIPALNMFVGVIITIGVVIGFAVVCLSMYMAVLQRTREIGILKALGASNGFILRAIIAEALLMGVGGTILGIIMSYGAWWLIKTIVPASIQMVIVQSWWPIALAITLIGTAFGALYPGLHAARHDAIEALSYE